MGVERPYRHDVRRTYSSKNANANANALCKMHYVKCKNKK